MFTLDLMLSFTDIFWYSNGNKLCSYCNQSIFIFWYETDFMVSHSNDKQADIIKSFNSTSRHLDDLLNINNPYFEGMVGKFQQSELQLNKANSSNTKAPVWNLQLSFSNGFVSSKYYDKREDFDFDIHVVSFFPRFGW